MPKILILANNDYGLYKFRKELIQELLKSNELYISLPMGDSVSELRNWGCKIIETPIESRGTNPFSDIKVLMAYMKILQEIKPDVVLSYTIKPNIYGGLACKFYNVPFIANITGLGTAVENKGILQKITLILYKISLKKARYVFFQNQENQEFFETHKLTPAKKVLIPGSGVNLTEYSILDYTSTEKTHFLFIARIMKEKGIDQYLEAAQVIRKKYPHTVFHILGSCEEEEYEDKLIKMQEKGIIEYHGMQTNVRKFLEMSHCTIHPTYYPEGMSNVLLESAASGRPIIATDRSGCREIVDDEVNGYLVEAKNSEDLIEKIEKFINLSDEAKKNMGISGRKKVEAEFDRNIVIDAYLSRIKYCYEAKPDLKEAFIE
ncbi:glycosyltransferase family 4 protein [Planomicrobium sp. CPCC 101079]|uniref:glycosyltransferase family 4 protein n=1 Tax=Planomicrobium sp. CPCC 101079 TaxID=2599618 RepID=UPI0011B501F0|nr:glycosyltransferase family 4 protein [Planomicrobium sp. CPCC 101079]TWT03633.1 glycosyltransferase family 4 protein [Planomicrobium sp. CPCC 101079]